jgi:hypothetical protein
VVPKVRNQTEYMDFTELKKKRSVLGQNKVIGIARECRERTQETHRFPLFLSLTFKLEIPILINFKMKFKRIKLTHE